MPDRREVIIGAMGAGAFGVSEFLRPRQTVRLFPDMELEDTVPTAFDSWREYPGGSVVAPTTPDSLADRLYSSTLSRVYYRPAVDEPPIMLLIAYGGEQSDLLQLHRPETCYPAVGFQIIGRQTGSVPLAQGASIPAVFLSASSRDRIEDIVYWTRLGEALPLTAAEQRSDRLEAAMRGTIGDGILVRASSIRITQEPRWEYLTGFLRQMMQNVAKSARPGFVGTRLAQAIA